MTLRPSRWWQRFDHVLKYHDLSFTLTALLAHYCLRRLILYFWYIYWPSLTYCFLDVRILAELVKFSTVFSHK